MKASKAVPLGSVSLLAAAFLGGCNYGDESSDTAYCLNAQEQVVQNDYCYTDADNGFGSYIWFYSSGNYHAGSHVSRAALKGGTAIPASNKAANAKAIASRGGLGGSARPSGVGRATAGSSGHGGGGGHSGGG